MFLHGLAKTEGRRSVSLRRDGGGDDERYRVSVWQDRHNSPSLRRLWLGMLRSSDGVTALHRSPEYFDYLQATEAHRGLDLLTVTDASDASILGIVPIRLVRFHMPFSLGKWTLARIRLRSLSLLGSEPMIPQDVRALDALFAFIDQRFRGAQVVDMKAVPLDGNLWRYVHRSATIRASFHMHVIHGARDFHSVSVPKSLAEYSHRLTRKRRYNFMRQQRLLEAHLGAPLSLLPIDNSPNSIGRSRRSTFSRRTGLC